MQLVLETKELAAWGLTPQVLARLWLLLLLQVALCLGRMHSGAGLVQTWHAGSWWWWWWEGGGG